MPFASARMQRIPATTIRPRTPMGKRIAKIAAGPSDREEVAARRDAADARYQRRSPQVERTGRLERGARSFGAAWRRASDSNSSCDIVRPDDPAPALADPVRAGGAAAGALRRALRELSWRRGARHGEGAGTGAESPCRGAVGRRVARLPR